MTGALHAVLGHRGEDIDRFVISVPVAGRRAATAGHLGNEVGVMTVPVTVAGDRHQRLAAIARTTRSRRPADPGASAALLGPVFRILAWFGVFRWFVDVDVGWRYACAVADHFWAGAAMQIEQVSEDEQTRRRAFNEDIRVSIALGISVEQVLERREQSAIDWMTWLTAKMIEQKADEPQHIMHVICARLEERGASLGRVRAERKLTSGLR